MDEKNTSNYYIGYAVSGLWRTMNNGTTYDPLFDEIGHSIGDIAIAPSNPAIVYVGTGEPNNRQSSSFGHGVYKSVNATAPNARDVKFESLPSRIWTVTRLRRSGDCSGRIPSAACS